MLDTNVPAEMQVVLFKGKVDVFSQVGIFLQMCCCEKHVLVAGTARSNDIESGLFRDGQIAGAKCVCQQFIDIEISCCTAAIPIFNFLEFDTEFTGRLHRRHVVTDGHFFQRASREVCVFFHSRPPIGMILPIMRLKLSRRLILAGMTGSLPFNNSSVAFWISNRNSRIPKLKI